MTQAVTERLAKRVEITRAAHGKKKDRSSKKMLKRAQRKLASTKRRLASIQKRLSKKEEES